MTAEIKALIAGWIDLLTDILVMTGVKELVDLAAKIDAKLAEEDA